MNAIITLDDLTLHNSEPCIQDLRLAEALGFEKPANIRKLIARNMTELQSHGEVFSTVEKTSSKGGRPGIEYLLNQAQALLICMFSRTEQAAMVRKLLIDVFLRWHRGEFGENSRNLPDMPAAPEDATPMQLNNWRVNVIRETRLVHGRAAARYLWDRVGMPTVPEMITDEHDGQPDGHNCLAHLLEADIDDRPLAAIIKAWDGEPDMPDLRHFGLRLADRGAGPELWVANRHPWLERIFAQSQWRQYGWGRALSSLAGAVMLKAQRFDKNIVARAVAIPTEQNLTNQ